MNMLIVPKIQLLGSTTDIPFVQFVQNDEWTTRNPCLSVENGYTNLNGLLINGTNYNSNTITSGNTIGINVLGNGNLILSTRNTQRLIITSNGNIGINTAINNNYAVNVNGITNASAICKNNIELDNIYLKIINNLWIPDTINNNIYNRNFNASVGINNSNPLADLHIGSSSNISDGTIIISKSLGLNSNRNFKMGYDNNLNFILGDYGNSNNIRWTPQILINSNANPFSINVNSNSFVGINNSNPLYTLDVNGTINAKDIIGVGSNITNINFNNIIASTIPSLSNINNWVNSNNENMIYTLVSHVNINTLTNLTLYNFNVNGSINGTSFYDNGSNFEDIYLKIRNADDTYINKTLAYDLYGSWVNTGIRNGTNATIYTSNITNYTVGINTTLTNGFILFVNGSAFINTIYGDGYNINNLNFERINPSTIPLYITSNTVNNLYYTKKIGRAHV